MKKNYPEPGWVHDPARDGAGCTWCGGFAQVNADNLCRECWEPDIVAWIAEDEVIIPETTKCVHIDRLMD